MAAPVPRRAVAADGGGIWVENEAVLRRGCALVEQMAVAPPLAAPAPAAASDSLLALLSERHIRLPGGLDPSIGASMQERRGLLGHGYNAAKKSNLQALHDLSDQYWSLNDRLDRIQRRRARAAADACLWAGEVGNDDDDYKDGLLRPPRAALSRLAGPSDAPALVFADGESSLLDTWDDGYAPPTLTELLPEFLLSAEAKAYVSANDDHYVFWNTRSMYHWTMYLTISRRLSDMAIRTLTGFDAHDEATEALPFRAVWEQGAESADVPATDQTNAPQQTDVPTVGEPRSGMLVPWLGCRYGCPSAVHRPFPHSPSASYGGLR